MATVRAGALVGHGFGGKTFLFPHGPNIWLYGRKNPTELVGLFSYYPLHSARPAGSALRASWPSRADDLSSARKVYIRDEGFPPIVIPDEGEGFSPGSTVQSPIHVDPGLEPAALSGMTVGWGRAYLK